MNVAANHHLTDSAPSELRFVATAALDARSPRRDVAAAEELAAGQTWLVDRMIGRLGAWWPCELDPERLRRQAYAALVQLAACVEDPACLASTAETLLDGRLRHLLIATDWWNHAWTRHARPLRDVWRGLALAGRKPTDQALSSRLHTSPVELAERFMEFVPMYVADVTLLLPDCPNAHSDLIAALTELPTEQQLASALYFDQELTLAEIGHAMGISPELAQELVGRALMAIAGRACCARHSGHTMSA